MEKESMDLTRSPHFWLAQLQLDLCKMVEEYLQEHKMSRTDFAKKLGVSKGYISQLLNGDFDSKLSKLVQLALACDCIPSIEFHPQEDAKMIIANNIYRDNPELASEHLYYQLNTQLKNVPPTIPMRNEMHFIVSESHTHTSSTKAQWCVSSNKIIAA